MRFLGTVGVTYVEWKSLAGLHRLHVSLAIIVCWSAKTLAVILSFWTWFIFYFLGTTTGYFLLEMFGIGSKLGSLIQWKKRQ